MQIIGRVFCKKINAQKRHKREALPAGGGCRNPVCLCVSRHLSQFSLFVYIIHCDGIGVQTPDDAAKLNKITETKGKNDAFLHIPVKMIVLSPTHGRRMAYLRIIFMTFPTFP